MKISVVLFFFVGLLFVSCGEKRSGGVGDNKITSEVFIERDSVKIFGTLEMPVEKGRCPVVLIIAGSGPTDRNGNNVYGVRAQPYKILADSLVKHSIASLRYDKRYVGKSVIKNMNESDLRIEDYVADAAEWIRRLKKDNRFSKLVVIGHSEGALIGALAIEKEKADGFISIAGAGRPADVILIEQLSKNGGFDMKKIRKIIDQIKQGRIAIVEKPQLQPIFRVTIQSYLKSWFRYNPADVYSRLDVPVLILQGTNDLQVSVLDAQKLDSACHTDKMILIKGMGHILKNAPKDRAKNLAVYAKPNLPLNAKLVKSIVDFVDTVK
jgi:hypothetical protein